MADIRGEKYRPTNSTTYRIPDTIDFPRKVSDKRNGKVATSLAILLLWLTILILLLYNLSFPFYITIPLFFVGMYLYILIIRFLVYEEVKISDSMEYLLENDFNIEADVFWGIFDIEDKKPFVVSYINGFKGVFLQLHKDITVGKGNDVRYKHYKGVEKMYRTAFMRDLYLVSLDTMREVEEDVDLSPVYDFINDTDQPILRDMLEEVLGYNQSLMSKHFSQNDILLVLSHQGSTQDLIDGCRDIIEASEDSNYHKVTYCTRDDVQSLAKSLYNLETFSINEAVKDTLSKVSRSIIVPIQVEDTQGNLLEKINLFTWEQKGTQPTQVIVEDETQLQNEDVELVDLFDNKTGVLNPDVVDIFDEEEM